MGIPYELTTEYVNIRKKELYLAESDECVGFINDIDLYLSGLEYRLFSGGLDSNDIQGIEDAINKLYYVDFRIKQAINNHIMGKPKEKRFNDEIKYQKYLLRVIGDIGIRLVRILKDLKVATGKYDFKTFVKDYSSLLHLVSTNNHSNQHIRKVSDDSFFYLCSFHNERSSSMRVNNNKNKLHCYGCGIDLNIFDYLRQMEGVSYQDAIYLLAEINKIRVDDNPFTSKDDIVKKYTCSRALSRYEMRVIAGRKRASAKNKTLNNIIALSKFDQELDTIRRIRNNEYIEYNPQEKLKKLEYKEVF